MNSVYKLLGVSIAFWLFSSVTVANEQHEELECGEVHFVHDLSKPSVFRIVNIDGTEIDNKFRLDARENRLSLPVGEHSLQIAEEPQMIYGTNSWGGASQIRDYYEDKEMDAYLFGQIKNHFLAVDIEPNKAYVFILTSDKKNLKLKKIVDKHCQIERTEKVPTNSYKSIDIDELSGIQRSKLYKLSKLLSRGKESADRLGQFMPLSVLTYFGVVIDGEFDDGAIKILSVQPMSAAFKLGLRSGDKIIKFNRRTSTRLDLTPAQLLEFFISLVHYYDDMKIVIERDGERKIVEGTFEPVLVPEAWFKSEEQKVAMSGQERLLDWHEQLFYSDFLRELLKEYGEELVDIDRLAIRSTSHTVDKLGLQGSLTKQGSMKLSFVDPYSVFASVGLKKGDEIASFGQNKRKPITIDSFTAYFKGLATNEEFYLEVESELGLEQKTGIYMPILYPTFEFVLDLSSVRKAEQNILLAYEEVKKLRKQSKRRVSRWKSKNKKILSNQTRYDSYLLRWHQDNIRPTNTNNNRPRTYRKATTSRNTK